MTSPIPSIMDNAEEEILLDIYFLERKRVKIEHELLELNSQLLILRQIKKDKNESSINNC
jgi:hypothetical protein